MFLLNSQVLKGDSIIRFWIIHSDRNYNNNRDAWETFGNSKSDHYDQNNFEGYIETCKAEFSKLLTFHTYGSSKERNKNLDNQDNNLEKFVEDRENEVYFIIDEMPKFLDGEEGFKKFIAENVIYPKIAQENGIQGKVYVTFIVGKDGSVSSAKIARGIDPVVSIRPSTTFCF